MSSTLQYRAMRNDHFWALKSLRKEEARVKTEAEQENKLKMKKKKNC